jgi:predicted XRE-type DNA-binding protein
MAFRLKEFMADLNIPQAELMELLDYSQSNISKIVTGRGRLPEAKLPILVKRYGEDVVARYISDDPLPTENIVSEQNSTNYGHHNNVNTDTFFAALLKMIDNYSEKERVMQNQITSLLEQNKTLVEENVRLNKLLHEGNITD